MSEQLPVDGFVLQVYDLKIKRWKPLGKFEALKDAIICMQDYVHGNYSYGKSTINCYRVAHYVNFEYTPIAYQYHYNLKEV